MHELSLRMNVIDQVTALASEHNAQAVSSIKIRIGVLSGVEPLLLENAFTIAQAGTVAAHACFITDPVPACIRCTDCGVESEVSPQSLRCGSCGSVATRLIAGDELTLESVDLIVADTRNPSVHECGFSIH